MYEHGLGVRQNYAEAFKWYTASAVKGEVAAANNLANMYVVTRNYAVAFIWYKKAAEDGSVAAQGNLGLLYADGRGVVLDYIQAYKWLSIASGNGHPDAARKLVKLKHIMPSKQVRKAELLASQWIAEQKKIFKDSLTTSQPSLESERLIQP
jgi:TPR repeat protein